MEAVFLSVPRPPPPIVFSFDLGSAFSSVFCIPYLTKRKRKAHQEKPPATQAKAKAHGRSFSWRIEHVGFSKLTQANLTEAEVECFMKFICSNSWTEVKWENDGRWGKRKKT